MLAQCGTICTDTLVQMRNLIHDLDNGFPWGAQEQVPWKLKAVTFCHACWGAKQTGSKDKIILNTIPRPTTGYLCVLGQIP